ncbi:uncharacterized protein LOC124286227 isoform X2 [Haliotis rubra]|uniref:uncharacterized protein LOC124286227 isoform X2 n=1 Tax=Haliotis rubra TaxID=36100 RepID=UPI001EE5036E|nr:uncharacterized protein LOC124286227 isoform X2 [Haliotis rubra]
MERGVVLSDGIRKRLNYFLKSSLQMEASHESSQSHLGTILPPATFPPYYPEQTTQPSTLNGAPCFYLGDRPTFEPNPPQIFARTDPDDQIPYAVLEYAHESGRQRLLYTPLTPPLTPQTPQQARGYAPSVYRDTFQTEGHRESTYRDSWPQFSHHPAATRPLYVHTQPWLPSEPSSSLGSRSQMLEIPISDSMTPESRQMMLEKVTKVVAEHTDEQREEFPLQDPPKPKYKRQLSEDSSAPNVSMATRYDNPPQSPRHAYTAPKTPQPESAHKTFTFAIDEDRGQMSPKRVKTDSGVARPAMSPLVHSEVQQPWSNPPRRNEQPPIFQFPDVSEARETHLRLYPEEDRQVYLPRATRCSEERLLEHPQWHPNDQRIPDRLYPPSRELYAGPPMVPREYSKYQRVVPGQCSPEKYHWRNPYVRSDPPVGQLQQLQRGSEVRQVTNSTLKRTPTVRSQSNIEYSPSKSELEQMEKDKYSRSVSKPEGPVGMHHLQRQYATKENVNGYYGCHGEAAFPAERPVEWSLYQDAGRQGACRQLFGTSEPCYSRGPTYRSPSDIRDSYTPHISQRGQLVGSNDNYDIYVVPHEPRSESVTSRPATSEDGNEMVYVQPRRQSISCSRDTCRNVSMVQGRLSPEKKHQKGQQIDIKIKCQDIAQNVQELSEKLQMKKTTSPCICEKVEAAMLKSAKTAFNKIRRDDPSRESHERFEREITEINATLMNALETAKAVKDLCGRHRKVTDIYTGSVVIAMQCTTLASLETLREHYKTGELKRLLCQSFVTERLKKEFGNFILLSVSISEEDFERCRRRLEEPLRDVTCQRKTPARTPRTPAMLSPSKRITKSADGLENIPSMPPTPVNHCRSASTPVLMTSSPLSSPTHITRSPCTPTKRDRVFSFTGRCPTPSRQRNLSLSSAGDISPRRIFQHINSDSPPCSPSKKSFTFIDAYSQQSSPRLRKSLEDITSDLENVSVHR